MAHFAQINEEGIVQRVIVVSDSDTADSDGNEVESIGVEFCKELLGGEWIQTSYNNNMRARFAGIGCFYDVTRDAFIRIKPYPSWELDESSADWVPPVPMPTGDNGKRYSWNEESLSWVEHEDTLPLRNEENTDNSTSFGYN